MRECSPCFRSYAVATTPFSAATRAASCQSGVTSMVSTRWPQGSHCVSLGSIPRYLRSSSKNRPPESSPISWSSGSIARRTSSGSVRSR